jgi:signal transduction histidine kinase
VQRFTLSRARSLREEAAHLGFAANERRGRFRARQLSTLSRRMLPTFAAVALISAVMAGVHAATSPVTGPGIVVEIALAAILAALAPVSLLLRKKREALLGLSAFGTLLAVLGWAIAIRLDDASHTELGLVPVVVFVCCVVTLELPPRAVMGLGIFSFLAVPLSGFDAPLSLYALAVGSTVGTTVLAAGQRRRELVVFRDTERLASALRRMRRLQEQVVVVEKLEALRVLVGGISHELNNALAISIASQSQATRALDKGSTDVTKQALDRSAGGLQRIQRTVDRLRRFAMAGEGDLDAANVAAMLDFALESAIGRARSGVIVDRAYDPELQSVRCHVSALAEALFQVARNAVEAMPAGGTIRAEARMEGPGMVLLAVNDGGRGIAEADLARVFDPFYKPEDKVAKSGLGLSAVYGLVSAMGGTVRIQSQLGKGTRVELLLPTRG